MRSASGRGELKSTISKRSIMVSLDGGEQGNYRVSDRIATNRTLGLASRVRVEADFADSCFLRARGRLAWIGSFGPPNATTWARSTTSEMSNMAIEVVCQSCGQSYQLNEKFAGQRAKCRECGAAIDVPALAS